MLTRRSSAEWKGTLRNGIGAMGLGSGRLAGPFTFDSRFEDGSGTSPEELIGAAHAGCYSMFLSALLSHAGFEPTRIETSATVHLSEGPTISLIELVTEAIVPGLRESIFLKHAEAARKGCLISKTLAGPLIVLRAKLLT